MYETVEYEPSLFLLKETGTPYLALTERHLQILWFEQKALSPSDNWGWYAYRDYPSRHVEYFC